MHDLLVEGSRNTVSRRAGGEVVEGRPADGVGEVVRVGRRRRWGGCNSRRVRRAPSSPYLPRRLRLVATPPPSARCPTSPARAAAPAARAGSGASARPPSGAPVDRAAGGLDSAAAFGVYTSSLLLLVLQERGREEVAVAGKNDNDTVSKA